MMIEKSALLDNVLCITTDNSPLSGTYLGAQGVVDASTLSAAGVARTSTYISAHRIAPYLPATFAQSAGIYVPGERVAAAVLVTGSTTTLRSVSSGWWALPAATPAGTCGSSAAAFALFRTTVPPTQCTRPAAVLSAASCEMLSATRLVSNLRLGITPLSAPNVPTGYVPVTAASVTVVNATTGLTSSASASFLASAFTTTASACTCTGVITGVSYIASYNGVENSLVSVAAHLTVTTLSADSAQCSGGSSPALLGVPITVAVSWVDMAALATAPAHQDARSGNPGYIAGSPLLAGVLVSQSGAAVTAATTSALLASDKVGIVRGVPFPTRLGALANLDLGSGYSSAGLTLRGPDAMGKCVKGDTASMVPVRFGEDISMSCDLLLDEAALNVLCVTSSSTTPYLGFWLVNASTTGASPVAPTHVGIFGNADPWKYNQWTGLSVGALPTTAQLDAMRGLCKGIATSLNIEFLYADVGESRNPQSEIIAVRTSYSTDTWSFLREDVRDTPAPEGSYGKQKFQLKTTVTFNKFATTSRADFVAPVPPIIATIPNDLWCELGLQARGANRVKRATGVDLLPGSPLPPPPPFQTPSRLSTCRPSNRLAHLRLPRPLHPHPGGETK